MASCYHCKKSFEPGDSIGRTETCPYCDSDLHVCKNCRHYDPSAYNDCLETQAERVLDKEKANFCDYFSIGESSIGQKKSESISPQDLAKAKLEQLFKKS